MQVIHTTIIPWMVLVSVLVSILASYAAFSFAERVATSKGWNFWVWLWSGAFAMGLGIWSMHYLGMLAVQLPIQVSYHVPTVILSLLLAVLAAAVALIVVSRDHLEAVHMAVGSLLMGLGIGGMHYVGMRAMRCSAMHSYDLKIVLLSVVVAVVFSWMALQIALSVRKRPLDRDWLQVGAAALMGLGIAAMHYTAMAAVTFHVGNMQYSTENTVKVSTIGTIAIAVPVAMLLCVAIVTALIDRRGYLEVQKLLDELSEERDRFQAAAESSVDALSICTAIRGKNGEIEDFLISYLNSNVAKMAHVPLDQLRGQKLCEKLPFNRTLGLFDRYKQVVLTGDPLIYEFPTQDQQLEASWVRIQAVKVRDGVVVTASDITARKLEEEQVRHMAHHDYLTGVLNRTLLRERVSQAMERAKAYKTRVVLFLIDLDEFKEINDTMGHATGDKVLVTVASRLKAAVRASDSVFRLGGDEFVILLTDIRQFSDVVLCAQKLVESIRSPMSLQLNRMSVTCSIGCAVYPESATDVDDLMAKADQALYSTKKAGKNGFHLYSGEEETTPGTEFTNAVPLT